MKRIGMKKVTAVIMAMSMMVISLMGCGGGSGSSSGGDNGEETGSIKIGGVYPLTGDVPALGAAMENGVKLAVKEINEAGGVLDRQLELISEDDENKPAVAPNAITKLIEQDKVVGVLGTYSSGCSIPMAAIAKEKQIPMISIGSTNEKVTTEGGDYVFRACFIDPWQGKVGAEFAYNNLGAKKAAMLYDMSQDYCIGISEAFEENFQALGGEVVYNKSYNKGDSDFKAFMTEIKGLDIDLLYLPDHYSTVGLVVKQAREMGIECAILGSDSWSDPGLIEVGGSAVEGCYFTDHASLNSDDEKLQSFLKSYQEEFGSDPSSFSILGYDSVYLMANAIKEAGSTDPEAVKDALKATDTEGLASHYGFDENGDPVKDIFINQVEDGKFVFVDQIAAQ